MGKEKSRQAMDEIEGEFAVVGSSGAEAPVLLGLIESGAKFSTMEDSLEGDGDAIISLDLAGRRVLINNQEYKMISKLFNEIGSGFTREFARMVTGFATDSYQFEVCFDELVDIGFLAESKLAYASPLERGYAVDKDSLGKARLVRSYSASFNLEEKDYNVHKKEGPNKPKPLICYYVFK
jgi:hypothetical protein